MARAGSATPRLDDVERGVLDAIAASYRQLQERGYGPVLSYERMAHRLDVGPVNVRWAVDRLVELLVAVERGRGSRANVYLPALPKRIAKLMSAAAADDALPPF